MAKLHNVLDSKKSSGIFFAGATVFAGFLHYLYQVIAAKSLDVEQFGSLTSWIAYVSVFLVVGGFFQFLANFFPLSGQKLKTVIRALFGFSIVVMASPVLVEDSPPYYRVGMFVVMMGPVFSWLSGQTQARLFFYTLGTGAILSGFFKFFLALIPLPGFTPEAQFYWAFVYGFGLPALFYMMRLYREADRKIEHRAEDKKRSRVDFIHDLVASLTLSFLAVFLPAMDIMVIDWTQDDTTLGMFSRIALIYKVIFFSLFIFSQWLLPQQMSSRQQTLSLQMMSWVKLVLSSFLIAAIVGGLAALTAPYAAQFALGFDFFPYRQWIFLSCFNITILKISFFKVQELGAFGRPLKGALVCIFLLLEWGIFANMNLDVESYLMACTCLNFCLLIWLLSPHLLNPSLSESSS